MGSDTARFAAIFLASLAVAEASLPTAYKDAASHVALAVLSLVVADLGVAALGKLLRRKLLSDLDGKAVLVTGCDSGFGHECAKRLDALGVTVYAGCLLPEGAGAAALKASTSPRLRVMPLDVTKDDSVQKAVQFVRDTIADKALWAVVNNAGVLAIGELQWVSAEEVRKVFDVNVLGVVRVTTAFLHMLIRSKGRVVCLGSAAGRITWSPLVVYSMTKHAIVAFADGLRRQMCKWSVTVHSIEPMIYRTNLTNEENFRRVFKRDWGSCPDEVRQQYGEEYFKSYVDSLIGMVSIVTLNNTAAVTDAMVDATVGANPKIRYACGMFASWILSVAPDRIVDVIMSYIPPNNVLPPETRWRN